MPVIVIVPPMAGPTLGARASSCGISRNSKDMAELAKSMELVVIDSGTGPALAGGDSHMVRELVKTVARVTACPKTHADPASRAKPTPLRVMTELPLTGPWPVIRASTLFCSPIGLPLDGCVRPS